MRLVDDDCGTVPVLICAEFENAGTLTDIWNSKLPAPPTRSGDLKTED